MLLLVFQLVDLEYGCNDLSAVCKYLLLALANNGTEDLCLFISKTTQEDRGIFSSVSRTGQILQTITVSKTMTSKVNR